MPELRAITRYNRQALRISRLGRKDDALCSLASAMRLAREVENPTLEAFSKYNMGRVYDRAGQKAQARACYRIALEIADLAPLHTRSVRRIIERGLNALAAH